MTGMQAMFAFAESARHGSFAAAARTLGLSASAVAKSVQRLEADLGLRLFHRSTRQVSLTSDGHELYQRCRRVVDELEALRAEAEGMRGQPSGTLRIDLPTTLGKQVLLPRLAALVQAHPALRLDLTFSDRFIDVVKEGVDAVVRIGPLADSALVARRIGEQGLLTIASRAYLQRHPPLRTPQDLAAHACLLFRNPSSGRLRPWQFRSGRRAFELQPAARAVLNDGEAIVEAVAAGLGIGQVPDYMSEPARRAGRVVEVLAAFRPAPMPISLVYPGARQLTPRLRALIEAFTGVPVNTVPPVPRAARGR